MQYKDYYKIMGLERNASADDIKRAYRKLARQYHPDVSKEAGAEEKFKAIGEAYEVLKDPKKRQAYNELGSDWQSGQEFRAPPNWGGGMNGGFEGFEGFGGGGSDFFEALFGAGFGKQRARRQPHARPGQDYHGKVYISLEEAFNGTERQVEIPNNDGTTRTLKVKIPSGVKAGQQIRVPGQGTRGVNSSTHGHLYLEVHFNKHPHFDVIDNDIHCTVPITPWEAALGATIAVPTLDKKVDLKIPAGSQGGQKLRLRGKGLKGQTQGDLYVTLKMVIPLPVTDEAKALYEKMATHLSFNPREKI